MIRFAAFAAAVILVLGLIWLAGSHAVHPVRVEAPPPASVVAREFPDRDESESAGRLLSIVARMGEAELRRQRVLEIDYISRELASPTWQTAPPPAELADILEKNAPALHLLRAELASNPLPVWKQRPRDLPEPPQPDQLRLNRLMLTYAADALAQRSRGRDDGAWSDLRAVWVITLSLSTRPEFSSIQSALTGARLIAAVAAKCAPPVPAWWTGYLQYDPRLPLVRALDYEAWAMRARADRFPIGEPDDNPSLHETVRRAVEPLARPIKILQADARARDLREVQQAVMRPDPCAQSPAGRSTAPWISTINRLDHFLIEREGVAKLLDAERERRTSGTWPDRIDERSLCRQQHWLYKRTAGGIDLSFTGHPPSPQTRIDIPLQYRR